jgi:hypothetical protein
MQPFFHDPKLKEIVQKIREATQKMVTEEDENNSPDSRN